MKIRSPFVTLLMIAAITPFSVACSEISDIVPEEEAAQANQALSPTTSAVAFQGDKGSLYESGPDYTGKTRGWIAPTTSPSIAEMDGGFYRDVFQGADANHNLWLNGPEGPHSLNIPMAPNTSPCIAGIAGGGYQILFQGSDGNLGMTGSWGTGNTGWPMKAGTSPSISMLPGSTWEGAFQGRNGNLWVVGQVANGDTGIPMAPNALNPAIAGIIGGGYQILFQGINGNLWMTGSWGTGDTGWPMKAGTSPSISMLPGSTWEGAFQGQNGNLWLVGQVDNRDTGLAMAAGTSPSIAGLAGGGYEVAYQDNNGHYHLAGTQVTADTGGLMRAGTSPSICPVFATSSVSGKAVLPYPGAAWPLISVNWSAVPGASSYAVFLGGSLWSTYPSSTLGLTYSNGAFSTNYSWYVRTCFPNGFCRNSNVISLRTPADPNKSPPPPPTTTTATINAVFWLKSPDTITSCDASMMKLDSESAQSVAGDWPASSIDSNNRSQFGWVWCKFRKSYTVSPGNHTVTAYWSWYPYSGTVQNAVAGGLYPLDIVSSPAQ